MDVVAGYERQTLLAEGKYTKVYRGRRQDNHQAVILKMLKESYPSPDRIAWFKQEYTVTQGLDISGVVAAYDIFNVDRNWVIVIEDFGGEALNRLDLAGKMSMAEFLELAINLVEVLGHIHHHNIIHKDINPANIVLNRTTGELKIIDFGISTVLSRETPNFLSMDVLEGTLPYISPEQTGRMNRAIDYRTDFYSLGVTFYELLTGRLPFQSDDSLGYIHAHIAQMPVPPHELNGAVPEMVSALVMKLMAKNSEMRYQSAAGLLVDLQRCAALLADNGKIALFTLGERETIGRFQLPQTLYGRDAEIARLLEGFQRAQSGSTELMLVAGYSGVGKSSLVHEIYKPLTHERGYFISGKFDQFETGRPYSAFIDAFRALIQQLLTESDDQVSFWRQSILDAVAPNGQVLIDVIPEIELILGEQPAIEPLSFGEAQNRFNHVFQQFLQVLATADHPLVLFLDDLQWVDNASLGLLKLLTVNPNINHFYVIGAYRDNEVGDGHPLVFTLGEIELSGTTVQSISLQPLSKEDCARFLGDSLGVAAVEFLSGLNDLVYDKTDGNPFFLSQFLQYLYSSEQINFDHGRQVWEWDLEEILQQNITDNVVDLLLSEMGKLPEDTQRMMSVAAGIRNRFGLGLLAETSNYSLTQIARMLWPALDRGFLIPLSHDYQLAQFDDEVADRTTYKFAHDRVQQASYELMPADERANMHLEIGHIFLARHRQDEIDETSDLIFDVANHLNEAISLIADEPGRETLAHYNLLAGRKAYSATAYRLAEEYLETGLSLLPDGHWESLYELSYGLHIDLATTKDLLNERQQAADIFALLHERSANKYDRHEVYIREMVLLNNLQMFAIAVDVGLEALQLFDYEFPAAPTGEMIGAEIGLEHKNRGSTPILDLLDRPNVEDPDILAIVEILGMILPSAFLSQQMTLWSLAILKTINLSHEHGNCLDMVTAFSSYGIVVSSRLGNPQAGYEFGVLSEQLAEKFGGTASVPQVKFVMGSFLSHWVEHIEQSIEHLQKGYQIGIASGSLQYAAYSIIIVPIMRLFHGAVQINDALIELGRIRKFGEENKLSDVISYMDVFEFVNNQLADPDATSVWDDEAMIQGILEQQMFTIVNWCHSFRAMGQYLLNDYDASFASAQKSMEYVPYNVGTLAEPLSIIYLVLNRIKLFEGIDTEDQETRDSYAAEIEEWIGKLANWAEKAPFNYAHFRDFAKAEWLRVQGVETAALPLYEDAISGALDNGYYTFTAIINEHAGRYYLDLGLTRFGRDYLRNAYIGYENWGAQSKTNQLKQEFAWITTDLGQGGLFSPSATQGHGTTRYKTHSVSTNGFTTSSTLDAESVIKASRAISGEIELPRLLRTLLSIVIESAGAQHGYLLLPDDEGNWIIEGEARVNDDNIPVLASIQPSPERLPLSVLTYVARTKTAVVLADARQRNHAYIGDRYIIKKQPQSVLCLPLVAQNRVTGLLYMENNLVHDAFTAERLEMLRMIAAQAAISIENARLYNQQVVLTNAYSRFVPPEYLSFLQKDGITDVQLGDHVAKEMAVMFTDIREFTTLSETMTSQENFDFVNRYWQRMSPHVRNQSGVIVKYLGDGMMAVFANGADDALRASVAKIKEVQRFNADLSAEGEFPINIGIGIHFGHMMAGVIGEESRMQGDFFSDDVNIASRIEGLCKLYGVSNIISESIYKRLEDPSVYHLRELDRVVIKGRIEPTLIYQVLDGLPSAVVDERLESLERFTAARQAYDEGNLAACFKLFSDLAMDYPEDSVFNVYLHRVKQLMIDGVPANWNGVWQMVQK